MSINYGKVSEDGWVKVFRHKASGGYWSSSNSWAQVLKNNSTNPNADLYSQLYKIENMKIENEYILKMVLEGPSITNIWAQTHNPLVDAPTAATVPGYRAIDMDSSANSWGGLSRSDGGSAYIDGNPANSNWYYPLGQTGAWSGGIPATTSSGQSSLELWVKIR
jgi:hypothetical protein